MRIAITRGRILEEALPLLAQAGIELTESPADSRKLILPTTYDSLEVLVLRSTDVITYVEHGTADFGIVGRDMLLEYPADNIYQLCDLNISKCRMIVAARPDCQLQDTQRIRVATKYPVSAQRHFEKKVRQIELIKLYGSIELAPLLDMSDVIVDLTQTGRTLKENNLVEIEEVALSNARLIANKALMKLKSDTIRKVTDLICQAGQGKHL